MKKFVRRIAIALIICALTSVAAFAKSKRASVTFPYNIKVNGTLVKKGNYDIRFDEQTKELSILKSGKVVAQATARIEKEATRARTITFSTTGSGDDQRLLSVIFGGSNEKLFVSGSEAAANE